MCLHKYVLSGMNALHTILCVDWFKNVNCAILRKIHWIVATYFLLSQHYFYYVVTLFLFFATKIGLAFLKLQEIL